MIARLVAVDIVAFALLGMAWHRGWVEVLWRADTTYLCAAIALVFAFGWGCPGGMRTGCGAATST